MMALSACDESSSGGSSVPNDSPKPEVQALANEVLKLNGKPIDAIILAISSQLQKHKLAHRLDQVVTILDENFTIECGDVCHIQQKIKEN